MRSRRNSALVITAIVIGLLAFSFVTSESLGNFGITVLSGLFQGMLLFLVASGLSIIFGLMDVLNLAQGAYFMVGAYVAYDAQHSGGLARPDRRPARSEHSLHRRFHSCWR
ncbi:MAG: hypothetical protein U0521_03110 [Anaerolineae bacterium]